MKVVLVNDQLNAGGAEKVLVNIANLLYKNAVEVEVVIFLKPAALDNLIHPSIPVHYLERKGRFDVRAMRKLKAIANKADIVHVHSRYNLRYLMVAKYLTRIFKPAIVFHEHVPVLSVDFITRCLMKKADAYVPVLKSMCDWAEQNLRIPPSKIFYLPNVVNSPSVEINQQPVGKKIMMVGNFWKFKNQVFAIKLLRELPEDYTLDIYGMVNDKNYYQEVLDLIASYQLQQRVKIIHGVNDIYAVAGNYNFAIHTSSHETGPLVLLEYMHAKLPFISYNTGDVVANIETELSESVMYSFNVEDWINRIQNVMMNENARKRLRERMKTILDRNYTEDSYYKKLQTIYNKVLLN